MKNSLAIAYAMKKKKMAHGSEMHEPEDKKFHHEEVSQPMEDRLDMREQAQMRGRDKMSRHARALMAAMGGQITDNYQSPGHAHLTHPDLKDEEQDEYDPKQEPPRKHNMTAMEEDEHKLGEHGEYEEGPEGPTVDAKHPDHEFEHQVENQGEGVEEDMVGHIMKQRGQVFAKGGEAHMCSGGNCTHYSHGGVTEGYDKHMRYAEGGRVANEDEEITDKMPAQYDDLHLDDHLDDDGKANYTGANSGDELGDKQEDEDRKDIVARIMHSRSKRDRMPRPA